MQLVASNVWNMTRWLLPMRRDDSPAHRSFHLQGTHHWETLWKSLMEFTDEFNLTRLHLDVNIPSAHEDYHATWVRPAYDDRLPQWQTEIPMRSGEHLLGRLVASGLHDGFSACRMIGKFMEALHEFEDRFEESVVVNASKQVGSAGSKLVNHAELSSEDRQMPALAGPPNKTGTTLIG